VGSLVGAAIGAVGGLLLANHDKYVGKEREELIGGAFLSGASLGATLGSVVAAGSSSSNNCPVCPTVATNPGATPPAQGTAS
jgi:hypothetical protein